MILLLPNDWDEFDGDLGDASRLEDHSGVRLNEVGAVRTSQQSSSYKGAGVRKAVSAIELLLKFPFAAWAAKLSVEHIKGLGLALELVFVRLDHLPRKLRIQLFDDAHVRESTRWQP